MVTEAWNGKVAVEIAAEQPFDLIVMDVQMPVMNGFEATQYIRKELQLDVPILALTANAVKGEKDKCINAGMDEYIAKPFEEAHLIKTISHLLKKADIGGIGETLVSEDDNNPDNLYSITTLQETAGADSAFIQQMLKTFIRQGKESLLKIDEALNERDMEAMQAIIHKMKPSINYLKMKDMTLMIRGLQGWDKGFNNAFADMVAKLKQKLRQTIEKMETDLPELFGASL